MSVKITWLFQMSTVPVEGKTSRSAGWSESWYDPTLSITGQTIRTKAVTYARARCALLPTSAKCIGARFLEAGTKASIAFPFSIAGAYNSVTDMPQTALLLRMQARADVNHFSFFLRCLPDIVVRGGEYTYGTVGGNNYTQSVISWWNFVATNLRFQGKDLTIPEFEIESIDGSGNVELKEEGTLYPVGSKVQILRTQFQDTCCGGGGTYKVKASVDTFKFQLSGWDGGQSIGGKVKAASGLFTYPIAFPPSVTEFDGRVVEKKVGRVFDQFRGRRSRTCCR